MCNSAGRATGLLLLIGAMSALVGCGGGGGSDDSNDSSWVRGRFFPASDFAARCARPRSGFDANGDRYPDVQGTFVDENDWLRSWTNDLYLWYEEVVDRDPGLYRNPLDYFELQKTTATTPSGNAKDRFHFTYPTDEWIALSQSGVSAGYGAAWSVVSAVPPREVVVAYSEPNTPASSFGLARGHRVLRVNGVDAVYDNTQAGVDVLNAGLFPTAVGQTFTFELWAPTSATAYTISMTSQQITSTPVQSVQTLLSPNGASVGYLVFNDHLATAEQLLVDAINQLRAANVDDLILDIRYNGGGFLFIASELAYMVAGDVTNGRTFEELQFNRKHPTRDPVTGELLEPIPFYNAYQPSPGAPVVPLPTLNLPRVFVLTGGGTCSASESIINSLRGIGVEVIQIGATTCGKPYGFYPTDNCGTTFFSIQFRGVNEAGFGDYSDGFSPSGSALSTATQLPGCVVADDYAHALGDPAEGRLAAALQFRDADACTAPLLAPQAVAGPGSTPLDGVVPKSPWLTNRILTD